MATFAPDGSTTASVNGALSSSDPCERPQFDWLPAERRRVLIADDDEGYREALAAVLERHGFAVEEVGDGERALKDALRAGPGLILSDVRMPRLDGLGLCRRVRHHNLLHRTPFMLITAWDDPDAVLEAISAGADDCLSKRTPLRELLERVQLVMERYAPRSTGGDAPDMSGRIGVLTPQAILQTCHLAELTGRLLASCGTRRVAVAFRGGNVVAADTHEAHGLAAILAFSLWTDGTFEFIAGEPGEGTAVEGRFEWLMLEVCRQIDESRRGRSAARKRPA
jgi:DNA-binding response OmpR family regulator